MRPNRTTFRNEIPTTQLWVPLNRTLHNLLVDCADKLFTISGSNHSFIKGVYKYQKKNKVHQFTFLLEVDT